MFCMPLPRPSERQAQRRTALIFYGFSDKIHTVMGDMPHFATLAREFRFWVGYLSAKELAPLAPDLSLPPETVRQCA